MPKRNRTMISTTIGKTAYRIVQQTAEDNDMPLSRTLDKIVREWAENRPQKACSFIDKISPTDQLESRLNTINKLADEVIIKLKRGCL